MEGFETFHIAGLFVQTRKSLIALFSYTSRLPAPVAAAMPKAPFLEFIYEFKNFDFLCETNNSTLPPSPLFFILFQKVLNLLEFFPESQKRPGLEISPCPVLLNSNIAPMEYASMKSPQNGKKLLQNPNNKPFLWSKLKHIVCRYSVACGHTLLLLAYSDVALKSHCSWILPVLIYPKKIPSLH